MAKLTSFIRTVCMAMAKLLFHLVAVFDRMAFINFPICIDIKITVKTVFQIKLRCLLLEIRLKFQKLLKPTLGYYYHCCYYFF